jgi:hypothetical protein
MAVLQTDHHTPQSDVLPAEYHVYLTQLTHLWPYLAICLLTFVMTYGAAQGSCMCVY